MDKTLLVICLLCAYGCLKELRPSEPFVTEYLNGPWINLTVGQIEHQVYPVWTYSYLCLLVAVFLLTDFLRYKPVIVVEGIAFVVTWCLLLWTKGLIWMQIVEFGYGIATSTEVAYYTYIYSVVDDDIYQKVTSFTRVAFLTGRFISGVLSQILVSTHAMDYRQLNYISLGAVSAALVVAMLLPSAPSSIYFNNVEQLQMKQTGRMRRFKGVLQKMATELSTAYRNSAVLKWSIWWAFATAGNQQVGNYIQPLWEAVLPSWENKNSSSGVIEGEKIYNGAVEAVYTALGAMAAFGVGYANLRWKKCGEMILGAVTILQAVCLVLMSRTEIIWVCYAGYIIFRVTYQALITVVSYQVAKDIPKDSYGLIFGCNTFVALALQATMTAVLVSKGGLELTSRQQFTVYGLFFALLAVLFLSFGARDSVSRCKEQKIHGDDDNRPLDYDESRIAVSDAKNLV